MTQQRNAKGAFRSSVSNGSNVERPHFIFLLNDRGHHILGKKKALFKKQSGLARLALTTLDDRIG